MLNSQCCFRASGSLQECKKLQHVCLLYNKINMNIKGQVSDSFVTQNLEWT